LMRAKDLGAEVGCGHTAAGHEFDHVFEGHVKFDDRLAVNDDDGAEVEVVGADEDIDQFGAVGSGDVFLDEEAVGEHAGGGVFDHDSFAERFAFGGAEGAEKLFYARINGASEGDTADDSFYPGDESASDKGAAGEADEVDTDEEHGEAESGEPFTEDLGEEVAEEAVGEAEEDLEDLEGDNEGDEDDDSGEEGASEMCAE